MWNYVVFSTDLILFHIFFNDCNASITSTAGDAGFGDIGNTEKDLDTIQKRREKKNPTRKNLDEL